MGMAWAEADQRQRNGLALSLLEAVRIQAHEVLAVTPRPELKPFFDLRYERIPTMYRTGDPEG
jgi:hypothetical protein